MIAGMLGVLIIVYDGQTQPAELQLYSNCHLSLHDFVNLEV